MDDEHCYRVAQSRDGRFDGTFVTAVLTTKIYCRPSCPAMTPLRRNVRFYPTPAAAQDAGFRACKRCRPDAAPGSPEWDARADLVARAVRLIGDGIVEREGVSGLAARVGYTPRQLQRVLTAELGTGALRLAMAHRVQSARSLLETTNLPVTDVALASGFGSIRQFNDRFREVFAMTPSQVRGTALRSNPSGPATGSQVITAHLTYRPPLDLGGTLEFLGRRAVAGTELWDGSRYMAVIDLPHGPGTLTVPVQAGDTSGSHPTVTCHLELADVRDYATAVSRVRRLLDLDADPAAIARAFEDDDLIGPVVAANPGRRVPGTTSPWEMAARAIIGQQVSVASARRVAARIAEQFGRPLGAEATGPTPAHRAGAHPAGAEPPGPTSPTGPTGPSRPTGPAPHRAFPTAEAIAGADPTALPLPARRAATLVGLAREVAEGRLVLDAGADRDQAERQLAALAGIGPWTAAYIRMRGLGDPDVFLTGDLVAERTAGRTASRAASRERWKPWRSYAVVHLWDMAAAAESRTETRRSKQ